MAAAAVAGPITLTPDEVKRAGIAVQPLAAARIAPQLHVLGTVLDPAALLRLRERIVAAEAKVAGAQAKVALERHQEARAKLLYDQARNISAADFEKARQDLAAAEALLAETRASRTVLVQEARVDWGNALAAALQQDDAPLLPQLAGGAAMLIAIGLPPGTALVAPPQRAAAEANGVRFTLRLIGPVPRMLGGYPGQTILYWAAAQPPVPVGAVVSAGLAAGPERDGVLVPRSAVVWRDGRALVFRASGKDRFEPVAIATDVAVSGGYFVSAALSPGDRVVVRGAVVLLGAGETPPSGGEDED